MIRHILFWKYTDTVKAEHKEAEALAFLQKSVATIQNFCTRVCKILVGYTCILRCGLQMKTLSFGIQWENAITQKPNFFIFG